MKKLILIILLAFLAGYALFEARFLMFGPQVTIQEPKDGFIAANPLITIRGRAKNAAWISLNGRQIFTDAKGNFSEKLIVSRGLSIMSVNVIDRFGREARETVRIIFNG